MKGLRQEDLVNQDLITELRKEFSMTHDDFYMVLTDTDMRVKVRTRSLELCPKVLWIFLRLTWSSIMC